MHLERVAPCLHAPFKSNLSVLLGHGPSPSIAVYRQLANCKNQWGYKCILLTRYWAAVVSFWALDLFSAGNRFVWWQRCRFIWSRYLICLAETVRSCVQEALSGNFGRAAGHHGGFFFSVSPREYGVCALSRPWSHSESSPTDHAPLCALNTRRCVSQINESIGNLIP